MTLVPSYSRFAPSSPAASRVKQRNRREGGRAEQELGRALWRLGVRYRRHVVDLPGKPDFVIPRLRLCVFVDGDFWHGRDWASLQRRLLSRANAEYWVAKIGRNVERDRQQETALVELGWHVVRLWETDVLGDPVSAARDLLASLGVGSTSVARDGAPKPEEAMGRTVLAP